MLYYSFKVERHEGSHFYAGLGATDDPVADAPAKSYAGWRRYPWNGGTPPTEAQLKADFTALAKDDKDNDIAGSSVKDALDAQLGVAPIVVTDASEKVTIQKAKKDEKGKNVVEDVLVAKKVILN